MPCRRHDRQYPRVDKSWSPSICQGRPWRMLMADDWSSVDWMVKFAPCLIEIRLFRPEVVFALGLASWSLEEVSFLSLVCFFFGVKEDVVMSK